MGPRLAFISPLAERCDNNNKWERDVEKKKKILCSSNGDNEGCLLLLCGVCYICSADESLNSFYVGLVCSSLFQTLGSRLARLQVPPTPVMTSRDPNQREFSTSQINEMKYYSILRVPSSTNTSVMSSSFPSRLPVNSTGWTLTTSVEDNWHPTQCVLAVSSMCL